MIPFTSPSRKTVVSASAESTTAASSPKTTAQYDQNRRHDGRSGSGGRSPPPRPHLKGTAVKEAGAAQQADSSVTIDTGSGGEQQQQHPLSPLLHPSRVLPRRFVTMATAELTPKRDGADALEAPGDSLKGPTADTSATKAKAADSSSASSSSAVSPVSGSVSHLPWPGGAAAAAVPSPSSTSSASAAAAASAASLSAFVVTDDYAATTATASSVPQSMTLQRLSLDRAVAPLLARAVAPFVHGKKSERKRALLNATYYSECFLHSIAPLEADAAALDAQSRYEKWWVEAKYRPERRQQPKLSVAPAAAAAPPPLEADGATDSSTANPIKKRRVSSGVSFRPAASPLTLGKGDAASAERQGDATLVVDEELPTASLLCSSSSMTLLSTGASSIREVKARMVDNLQRTGGDVSTTVFAACLDRLHSLYSASGRDDRQSLGNCGISSSSDNNNSTSIASGSSRENSSADGTWIALSKPTFTECLGRNSRGQYLYTLGRLSFDMFRPTALRCSLQGVFNTVSLASAPPATTPNGGEASGGPASRRRHRTTSGLHLGSTFSHRMVQFLRDKHARGGRDPVRHYDITVAFTIEAHQTRRGQFSDNAATSEELTGAAPVEQAPGGSSQASLIPQDEEYRLRQPIRGLLTNHGYMIPDPNVTNRHSIWFSGGSLECHRDEDLDEWKRLFNADDLPRRDLGEFARVLAAKFLLGATVTTTRSGSSSGGSPSDSNHRGVDYNPPNPNHQGVNGNDDVESEDSDDDDDDGSMSYQLRRAIGGHGQVFCDVLYADEDLRVLRGHHGTVYVHRRVPDEETT